MERMKELDQQKGQHFHKSREGELIVSICKARMEKNVKHFATVVKKYSTLVHLDDWVTKILLCIRRQIEDKTLQSLTGEVDLT